MFGLLSHEVVFASALSVLECESELRQLGFLRNVRDSRSRRYLILVEEEDFRIDPEPKIVYTREYITYVSATGILKQTETGTSVSLDIHPNSSVPPEMLLFGAFGILFIVCCLTTVRLVNTLREIPVSPTNDVLLAFCGFLLLLAMAGIGLTDRNFRPVANWLAKEVEYRLTVGPEDRSYVARPRQGDEG